MTPTAPAPHAVDVLSLNVWGLPWPISRARGPRFRRILEHLSDNAHDIVGLQELWGGTHRLLERLAPHLPRGRGDSGLALAGVFRPLERPRLRAFRRGSGVDRLKAKGVLDALVTVPGLGELRVLVTHLQADARHATTRAHQVDELLEEAASQDIATVLMGDFNLYAGDHTDAASAARLAAAGFRDAALEAGDAAPTYCSRNPYVGGGVAERFDRVYLRNGPRVWLEAVATRVLQPASPLSDHHPLFARLRARPTPRE